MTDRVVVYSSGANSEASGTVADRLRASGVQIVEEQPKMILVKGASAAIKKVVDKIPGWDLTAEETVEAPPTRERVLKPPSE